ncbi:flavin monoamine oxidase family protein [Fictibacillus sp. 23RED33]|uniref:flavin monoamine oxidase family protein n=1 Tax=Fictibacillus sp. 23RED33 TaxID=2745879 RepID=UPI0018CDBF21|nr:flavin monoamine oxidase family protein [Fictibacillus sp. 23RED33]MBH0175727.1 flavin monoamine oxidase family protein [Fictibacillus sp. 23RED33]
MREYREELKYPEDMLLIIRNGLINQANNPKTILIVGSGMTGLVAGSLLKHAGHNVIILEADQRIGGRIYTVRQPFTSGNYMDFGAMRIPNNHLLVMEYIRLFNLTYNSFLNSTPDDLIFVNNILTSRKAYDDDPRILRFPVEDSEKDKTATELFIEATKPFIDLYKSSSPEEKKLLERKYETYSIDEFLQNNPFGRPLSQNAIRSIAVMLGIEGFPQFSAVDILTDIAYPIFSNEVEFNEIQGGNDRLPYAFLPYLNQEIRLNQRVETIHQSEYGVTIQTRDPNTNRSFQYYGDYALVTVPFSVLQTIDLKPYDSISFKKWQVIRELVNVPAVKIGIEFRTKFWEVNKVGNNVSDLTSRFTYVPSHDVGKAGPGVLVASYSWGQDALLWSSMPPKEKTRILLKDLAKIYGDVVYTEYIQDVSFDWSLNPYSAGCFTLFTPGQDQKFAEIMRQPEGRIHFGGEHTSSFHGWIEGAVESGIRTAYEINNR